MPMLRTYPDSLNYNFENIKGIVHIHFGIDVEIKEKRNKKSRILRYTYTRSYISSVTI